jgi:hypothetical protein
MFDLKTVLRDVKARSANPAISILLPTSRTFPDHKQDPINLKNLVKEVEARLLATMDKREVRPIMEALGAAVGSHDHQHNLDGLAVYAGADGVQVVPLPFPVTQRAIIDANFATRDLVRGLHDSVSYLVLVVSRQQGRLIHAYNDRLVHEFGRGTDLRGYNFPIRNNSLYSTSAQERSQAASEDNLLKEFLNVIDKSVQELQGKRGSDRLPIILVGDARNVALYRQLCDRPTDIVGEVTNAPDLQADAGEIVVHAGEALNAYRHEREQRALEQMRQSRGANSLVSDLSLLYRAAAEGNARRLFVRRGYHQPGIMDAATLTIEVREDATQDGVTDDVVDELIELVQDTGGDIVFLSAEALGDGAPLSLQARH